jgi:hypothetical protein
MPRGLESPQAAADTAQVLSRLLHRRSASFSVGVLGAVAEFHWAPGDRAEEGSSDLALWTARGGIRITPHGDERRTVLPRGDGHDGHDGHGPAGGAQPPVVYWLPREQARLDGGRGLWEHGADSAALRRGERADVLFDLGLALGHVLACVRSGDPELLAALRAHPGADVLAPGSPVMAAIKRHSPHRVFLSRMARIEVYQPIPSRRRGERTPAGPHTHLLPALLGQADASLAALPAHARPLLTVYPAST